MPVPWKTNAEILREAREEVLAHPYVPEPEARPVKYVFARESGSFLPGPDWPVQGRLPRGLVIDEDGLVRPDSASPDA